jgi:hypothetical protein
MGTDVEGIGLRDGTERKKIALFFLSVARGCQYTSRAQKSKLSIAVHVVRY